MALQHNEGSHDRWNDRHEFAERLRPGPLRDGLLDALEGRGAFGRFARALDREPALLAVSQAFSAEREVGRARGDARRPRLPGPAVLT